MIIQKTNMRLEINCKITVPRVEETVEMSPKELLKFHDDLTRFINDNWEAINKEDLKEDN